MHNFQANYDKILKVLKELDCKMDYLHQDVEEEAHVIKEDIVKPKKKAVKKEKKNPAELNKGTKRIDR